MQMDEEWQILEWIPIHKAGISLPKFIELKSRGYARVHEDTVLIALLVSGDTFSVKNTLTGVEHPMKYGRYKTMDDMKPPSNLFNL